LGPPSFLHNAINQGGTAESSSSLFYDEGDFLFVFQVPVASKEPSSCKLCITLMVKALVAGVLYQKDRTMARTPSRSLADRLRELLDTLRNALSPREPAPVPIPVRSDPRRR